MNSLAASSTTRELVGIPLPHSIRAEAGWSDLKAEKDTPRRSG
jgi:hypothetical protein